MSPIAPIRCRVLLVALGLVAVACASAKGAERELSIDAPAHAAAGSEVVFTVHVATHVGGGEQIGFFHGEYSTDDGRHWTGVVYDQGLGAEATRPFTIRAGATGTHLRLRVRVAFRDGAAGDVDFSGAAIRWSATWKNWNEPPARIATVAIDGS